MNNKEINQGRSEILVLVCLGIEIHKRLGNTSNLGCKVQTYYCQFIIIYIVFVKVHATFMPFLRFEVFWLCRV